MKNIKRSIFIVSVVASAALALCLIFSSAAVRAKGDAGLGITALRQISEDTLKVGLSASGLDLAASDIIVTYDDDGKKIEAVIEDILISAKDRTEGKIKMLAPLVAGKEYTFKLGKSKRTLTAASLTLRDVAGFTLLDSNIPVGSLSKIDFVLVNKDGVAIPNRIVNDNIKIANTRDSEFDIKKVGNSWAISLLAPNLTFPLEYEFYSSYMDGGRAKVNSLKGSFEVTGIEAKDQKDYYSFDFGFDQNRTVRTLNLEDGEQRLFYKAVLEAKNTMDQYEIFTDSDSTPRYDFLSQNSDVVKVAKRNRVVYFTPLKTGTAIIDVYRYQGTILEKKVGSFSVEVLSREDLPAGSAAGTKADADSKTVGSAAGAKSSTGSKAAEDLPVLILADAGVIFELSAGELDTALYTFNNDGTGITPAKAIPEISISSYKVNDGEKLSKAPDASAIRPSTELTKAAKKKTAGKLAYWFTVTDSSGKDVTALFTDPANGDVISGWSISGNTTYNSKSGAYSGGHYNIVGVEKLPAGTCTVSFARTGGGSAYTKLGKLKFDVTDSEYKPDVRARRYDIDTADDEHVKSAFEVRHYSSLSNKSYEIYNSVESFRDNYEKIGKNAVFVEKFDHQILLELGDKVYVYEDPITLNAMLHVGGYRYGN